MSEVIKCMGLMKDLFKQNYQVSIEDGHTDKADRVAWDWTEEQFSMLFQRIKQQYKDEHQEAVFKAFNL